MLKALGIIFVIFIVLWLALPAARSPAQNS